MRILIIDPDSGTAAAMGLQFDARRLLSWSTDSGEEALGLLRGGQVFDLAVLAQDTTDLGGLEVLRAMRAAGHRTPVILLSDSGELADKVAAFNAGADDVLARPVHIEELVARIQAIVRRYCGHADSQLVCGPISLSLSSRQVRVGEEPVQLTGREHRLLETLMLRPGHTFSKFALMDAIYGGIDEPEVKIIDVFICKLRTKLRPFGEAHRHLETDWAQGYRVVAEPTRGIKVHGRHGGPVRTQRLGRPTLTQKVLDTLKASPQGLAFAALMDRVDATHEQSVREAVASLSARGLLRNAAPRGTRASLYRLTERGEAHAA